MKTKIINIYKFEELEPEAQEKVLSDFREQEEFYFLEDCLTEDLKQELDKNKIEYNDDLKVLYSLSCCQGDGFCFIGTFKTKNAEFKITHNSRYYHKKSTEIVLINLKVGKEFKDIYDLNDKQENKADKILIDFENQYYNICDDLEKLGYAYIDDTLKDEHIKENIELNEYTFRSNGEMESL